MPALFTPQSRRWLAAVLAAVLLVVAVARGRAGRLDAAATPTPGATPTPAQTEDLRHLQRDRYANPDGMRMSFLPVRSIQPAVPGLLRLGVLQPATAPVADVVFLHGHADRLDNHMALFKVWAAGGARVIALDWPSHGQSDVGPLDIYTADDLIALVRQVERATVQDPSRPLVLAGWSYGGLIATRLAQLPAALQSLSRRPAGLLLLAPGVVVQPFVGGDGIARVETLLHAPYAELAGPPSPASPLLNPVFALRTLVLAWQAQHAPLPTDLPVQAIVADDANDWYVNSSGIKAWALQQQARGVPLQLLQCPGARHALDNEPWPIGPRVQSLSLAFVHQVAHALPHGPQPAASGGAEPVLQQACQDVPAPAPASVALTTP